MSYNAIPNPKCLNGKAKVNDSVPSECGQRRSGPGGQSEVSTHQKYDYFSHFADEDEVTLTYIPISVQNFDQIAFNETIIVVSDKYPLTLYYLVPSRPVTSTLPSPPIQSINFRD